MGSSETVWQERNQINVKTNHAWWDRWLEHVMVGPSHFSTPKTKALIPQQVFSSTSWENRLYFILNSWGKRFRQAQWRVVVSLQNHSAKTALVFPMVMRRLLNELFVCFSRQTRQNMRDQYSKPDTRAHFVTANEIRTLAQLWGFVKAACSHITDPAIRLFQVGQKRAISSMLGQRGRRPRRAQRMLGKDGLSNPLEMRCS